MVKSFAGCAGLLLFHKKTPDMLASAGVNKSRDYAIV